MRNAIVRISIATVLGAGLAAAPAGADKNEFITTWKAPGAEMLNFAGRKVAAVLIIDDNNLRVSAEEALAREVTARGSVGVPAYRIIPREELANKDAAKGWFERAGVQGLVVLRLVETEKQKVYSSSLWVSGYYGNAWDYWGYGWGSVYPIGKAREQRIITVETLLYDLSKGTPIWAAVTRTTDPKDVQAYVKELAIDVIKRLEKDGLVRKGPK
jgi:hypothetical protein